MDPTDRRHQLQELLLAEKDMIARLEAHAAKLGTHHASKERDRAVKAATSSIRRHDKARRRLERALRVQA
jgi:hypothetical protein